MVSTAARVGSINIILQTQLGPGMAGLNAFANAVENTGRKVQSHVGSIDRTVASLNTTLARINSRGLSSVAVGALQAKDTLEQLRRTVMMFGVALGGLAPAAIAAGMIRTIDAAHRMTNQLRTVTQSTAELKAVQNDLFDLAQRTRSSFESTITIYARTARATEHLGLSQQKLLRVTETIQKAFAIGGATTQEAFGAAIQLSQGIASNRFSGEEFRSVAENAPVLMRGIAESLGVTIGKLREMAHAGELTADVVVNAILGASKRIDDEFAKTVSTIEQAWVKVGNAIQKYAMDSQGASAASYSLVTVLNALAANIDTVADAIMMLSVAAGAVWGGRKGTAIIHGMTEYISNLKKMREETVRNAEIMRKVRVDEALAAATNARQMRQRVIEMARARDQEIASIREAMLIDNVRKATAEEQRLAETVKNAGEVRAAADAKVAKAKEEVKAKWSQLMVIARKDKEEAIARARAAVEEAAAQKKVASERLNAASMNYVLAKTWKASRQDMAKVEKTLHTAFQENEQAAKNLAQAQANLQTVMASAAPRSLAYEKALAAMTAAKERAAKAAAAAAAAEKQHMEAVAAHAAAEKNLQAALISGNLTREQEVALAKRTEMLEKKVAAAKAQSAAATLAARDAAAAAKVATEQLAAAQAAATTRAMAFAAAGRALSAVWNFIGGGFGAAMLAIGAVMYIAASRAAEAEAALEAFADAIKDAGGNSRNSAKEIREAAEALELVRNAATEAAERANLLRARENLDEIKRNTEAALNLFVAINEFSGTTGRVARELRALWDEFINGRKSLEDFISETDKLSRIDPDVSKTIEKIQDIARTAVAAMATIDLLNEKVSTIGVTNEAEKADRLPLPPISDAEFNERFGRRYTKTWKELFPDLFKDTPKGRGAPKTADDRFDNLLQSIADRTVALAQEREALNLTYAEQLRRQEALKLEQEALRQVREEARRKGEADWQNAQLTPEQVQRINERVDAYVREAMALKQAKESQEAWNNAAGEFGGIIRGLIEGTMDWRDALLKLIPIVIKLLDNLNKAQGGLGLFGGGWFQSLVGGILGISFHTGGEVGKGGNPVNIPLNAPFAGVFHGGGNFGGRRAKHDEVLALVQAHENIFTADQTEGIITALRTSLRGAGARNDVYAPVYNIDARGSEAGVEKKIRDVLEQHEKTSFQRWVQNYQQAKKRNIQ